MGKTRGDRHGGGGGTGKSETIQMRTEPGAEESYLPCLKVNHE